MQARLDHAWQGIAASYQPLPLVSVILPTRNRAGTLEAAILSVLAQDYPQLELLVIDDGSRDGTLAMPILGSPRVRVIHTPNRGVAAARNAGLSAAKGAIIAYLDSDNRWRPRHLRNLVTALEVAGVECVYDMLVLDRGDGRLVYRGEPFDRAECVRANYIDLNVFAHRVGTKNRDFFFDPQLRRGVDWDFILRLTNTEQVAFVPVLGCDYADHPWDGSRISRSEPRMFLDLARQKAMTGLTVSELLERHMFKLYLLPEADRDGLGAVLARLGHEVCTLKSGEKLPWRADAIVLANPQDLARVPSDMLAALWLNRDLQLPPYFIIDRADVLVTTDAAQAAHITATLRRPVVQVADGDVTAAAEAIMSGLRRAMIGPRRSRSQFPVPALIGAARSGSD
jgi:hypothetical protein